MFQAPSMACSQLVFVARVGSGTHGKPISVTRWIVKKASGPCSEVKPAGRPGALALTLQAFQIPRTAVRPGPPLAEKGPALVCRRSSTPSPVRDPSTPQGWARSRACQGGVHEDRQTAPRIRRARAPAEDRAPAGSRTCDRATACRAGARAAGVSSRAWRFWRVMEYEGEPWLWAVYMEVRWPGPVLHADERPTWSSQHGIYAYLKPRSECEVARGNVSPALRELGMLAGGGDPYGPIAEHAGGYRAASAPVAGGARGRA